jgi:CheY-like chemotaxis protein
VVIRRALRSLLTEAPDVELVGAATAAIALQRLDAAPHIITLDVEPPDMNGLELLERIRRQRPHQAVNRCSGLTERSGAVALEALSRGASDCVAKPSSTSREASMAQVREEVNRWLPARPARGLEGGGGARRGLHAQRAHLLRRADQAPQPRAAAAADEPDGALFQGSAETTLLSTTNGSATRPVRAPSTGCAMVPDEVVPPDQEIAQAVTDPTTALLSAPSALGERRAAQPVSGWTGCVKVSGARAGEVTVSYDDGLTSAIAETLGLPEGELSLHLSLEVLAEMTNVIGGNIKSMGSTTLDRTWQLSLRQVAEGWVQREGRAARQLEFSCSGWRLRGSVRQQSRPDPTTGGTP